MQYGAGFPLTAMDDPVAIRDFAQTLDSAGFGFVTASGHVLSTEPGAFPANPTPTYAGPFHDPFVLFGYLAGLTRQIHFRNSILILPLFPTGLIAKQGAELDTLSGGRFELGVGISWNRSEYRAMNQEFTTRGRRLEEQVTLLRRLWNEPSRAAGIILSVSGLIVSQRTGSRSGSAAERATRFCGASHASPMAGSPPAIRRSQ